MTNAEFYKDILVERAFNGGDRIAVKKDTLELCKCAYLPCRNCLFYSKCNVEEFVKWCNSEHILYDERITKNTPIDTKVLVSEDKETWFKRHFAKIENDRVYTWGAGTTSFSTNKENVSSWTYAKLYEE